MKNFKCSENQMFHFIYYKFIDAVGCVYFARGCNNSLRFLLNSAQLNIALNTFTVMF